MPSSILFNLQRVNMLNILIIGVTVVITVMAWQNKEWYEKLNFHPYAIRHSKEYYRFASYGLLHSNWAHLGVNMFVLLSFGNQMLSTYSLYYGAKGYLFFILLYVGGLVGSVVYAYHKHKEDYYYHAIGASGAVSTVLFSSILYYPLSKISIFPIPIGIPAVLFGVLYIAFELYMHKRGKDNIGHDVHIGGAVFGILFNILINPSVISHFFSQFILICRL